MIDLIPLWYWMEEREKIRLKKEAGEPGPWTDDPILREFRFCNVRREDDRVTRWIDEHIRQPYKDHPNLWFMLCIARQINWPETLQELIDNGQSWPDHEDFCPTNITSVLEARKARGDKVYTGAYMIRAESDTSKPWYNWTKQRYMAEIVLGRIWAERHLMEEALDEEPTIEGIHSGLMMYHGWGPFMAYQVCVDLRFTRYLENAPDVESWCAAGPGTIRGLNRLHGRDVKAPLSQAQALEEIRDIYRRTRICFGNDLDFDFSDIPNVLCETDKYLRVKNGEGKPRAKFVEGRGY